MPRNKFKVKLSEEALADLLEAKAWYKSLNKTLGERLKKDFDQQVGVLKNSLVGSIMYDDKHCLPLKVFPYMIHYYLEDQTIFIVGLIHTSLNPEGNWKAD